MSRHLAKKASIITLIAAIYACDAFAQQSLPTIDVGSARRVNPTKRANNSGASRTTIPIPARSGDGIPALNIVSSLPDRYSEPKPAPFTTTLPANIPAVVATRSAKQIDQTVNIMTTAEAFKYLPSVFIRERFIGDQNASIQLRTTGSNETAKTIVYADNILLSNFLGNDNQFSPKWGMVSPEEISRIDVVYGPFSALYPGNSIGGVLAITTRMPEGREIHFKGLGAAQTYSLYGYNDVPLSGNINILVGDKINDFRYFIAYNHLDSSTQPNNYTNNWLGSTRAAGPVAYGGYFNFNQNGLYRVTTGANSIEHTVQDLGKVKLSYDVAPQTRLIYQAGFWNNNFDRSVQSFIYDRNGVPLFNSQSGNLQVSPTSSFNIAQTGMNPSHGSSQNLMQAIQLKRDSGETFDVDFSLTSYNYLREFNNTATSYGFRPNNAATSYNVNPTGQNARLDGTYWRTGDVRFIFRPNIDVQGKHEISLGSHTDLYSLNNTVNQTAFWPSSIPLAVQNYNTGKTQTNGIYIQDAWKPLTDWKIIAGARTDFWSAFNGSNAQGGFQFGNQAGFPLTTVTPLRAQRLTYPEASKAGFQPKGSIEYQMTKEFNMRGSLGRAYRFPTVSELFQSFTVANAVVAGNPDLRPESSTAWDLTGSYRTVDPFGGLIGLVNPRVSLFLDDRWNTIVRQTVNNQAGQLGTQWSNINRARYRGVEAELIMKDIATKGLDFSGSVTFTDSRIVDNFGYMPFPYPLTVAGSAVGFPFPVSNGALLAGNQYPRIPRIRIRSVISYAPSKDFSFAFGTRYSSATFATLSNIDFNHNTQGGVSEQILFDTKLNYQFEPGWTATIGIDNVGRFKAYEGPHPLPQRTYFLGVKYDFGGPESTNKNIVEADGRASEGISSYFR
jgi:iron complex outermembrane recepter protein